MRQIKLSGREQAVLRAIDYATGTTGARIAEITHIDPEDVADLLSSLEEIGYVEPTPYTENISLANYADLLFEINAAYAQELKLALRRH